MASSAAASSPSARPRASVSGCSTAPALSSVPSIPSVSQAMAQIPGAPSSAIASDSRNSALRPPRPAPRTVTVVSPPDNRTQGVRVAAAGERHRSASCACSAPQSCASPSMSSPSNCTSIPAARATSAARASAMAGVAISWWRTARSLASPGFGVSQSGSASHARTAAAGAICKRCSMACASWRVLASAAVGPEAMTDRSSPGTSEITRLTTAAPPAASASLPPLIADRCLRTQLISRIVAPLFSNSRVSCCLSASVTGPAGSASSDDPPPDSRHSSRSSGVSCDVAASARRTAVSPSTSGIGCPASTISMRLHGRP